MYLPSSDDYLKGKARRMLPTKPRTNIDVNIFVKHFLYAQL